MTWVSLIHDELSRIEDLKIHFTTTIYKWCIDMGKSEHKLQWSNKTIVLRGGEGKVIVENFEHRYFLFFLYTISIHVHKHSIWGFSLSWRSWKWNVSHIEDRNFQILICISYEEIFYLSIYFLWMGFERTIVAWESNWRKLHARLCLEVIVKEIINI